MKAKTLVRMTALCVLAAVLLCACSSGGGKGRESGETPKPASATFIAAPKTPKVQTDEPDKAPGTSYPKDDLNAEDGQYTIAWVSDPQYYTQRWPDTYEKMMRWLVENRQRLNIGYIVHTGDHVQEITAGEEWETADRIYSIIDDIPSGTLAGNHDVLNDEQIYTYFCEHFGEARFKDRPYYGESFLDNRGHYDLMELGQTRYIFVYMGYVQTEESLKWMDEVFKKYPDRFGILVLHDYLDNDGKLTEDGQKVFKKVVKTNPNVRYVLCGHRYRLCNASHELDDDRDGKKDRVVQAILGNYQCAGNEGGSGFMRFLKVDEKENRVYMYSYSPILNEYVYYDTEERQQEKYASDPEVETQIFKLYWEEE